MDRIRWICSLDDLLDLFSLVEEDVASGLLGSATGRQVPIGPAWKQGGEAQAVGRNSLEEVPIEVNF